MIVEVQKKDIDNILNTEMYILRRHFKTKEGKNDYDLIGRTGREILNSDPVIDYEPTTLYGKRVKETLDLFFTGIESAVLIDESERDNEKVTVRDILDRIITEGDIIFIKQMNSKHNGIDINLSKIIELTKNILSYYKNDFHLPKPLKDEWLPILSNEKKLKPVAIYNMESQELHSEAKIFGGNPDGIVNFNDTPHRFAVDSFKSGQERNWVAEQVNVNEDIKIYPTLSPEKQRQLLLGTAQPTTNDSIQTAQIARLMQYVSSPVVGCALSRQQYEEALHSQSYSRLILDVVKENYIFYMHREYINGEKNPHFSPELFKKNDAVRRMYSRLYQTEHPTLNDLLMILVSNQILEEMVFPGAFAFNFAFDERLVGFISMYAEIAKDETLTHVPLVMNMFRAAIKESCNDEIPEEVKTRAKELIIEMTEEEIEWTNFLGKGVRLFTPESIDIFIKNQANSVCRNLGLELIYPEVKDKPNPLRRMMMKNISAADNVKIRSSIFEINSMEYIKNGLENDL